MYVCVYVLCTYICMYVCMYLHIYVCMYVQMYDYFFQSCVILVQHHKMNSLCRMSFVYILA